MIILQNKTISRNILLFWEQNKAQFKFLKTCLDNDMFLDWISWERKFWILGAVLSNRDASSVFLPHSFCLLSGNFRLFSTNVVDPDNFILQTYITQPFLKPKQVSNVGISCVFSCVQSMWFHKSQRWLGGHFMTAGPVEEGVTQEKQIVITVSSLTFSYTYLLYFSLHLIAGLLETTHGEKSQKVITANCIWPYFPLQSTLINLKFMQFFGWI